jgi:hypothetical protein
VSGKSSEKTPDSAQPMKDHAFVGMWRDREDMKDLVAWLRNLRRPRYTWDDKLGVVRTKPLPAFIKS